VKLKETPKLDGRVVAEAEVSQESVLTRVRHFAVLRATHRALTPSSSEPPDAGEQAVIRGIRERLGELRARFGEDGSVGEAGAPRPDELQELDGALAGYRRLLLSKVESLPLSQLRASLAAHTHQQRVEVAALLQLCLESEKTPARFLRIVDFVITLLCIEQRNGAWVVAIDPANLNDVVRERCALCAHLDSTAEARIVTRFQEAAARVAPAASAAPVLKEISAYKADIASFYFNPAVLRCIVGYNAAARNHFEARLRERREHDAAIDDELGLFAPLQGSDPRTAGEALPPHESPGVVAVQEAIRRRLLDAESTRGPAERIAEALDLSWLGRDEREALLDPAGAGTGRLMRMSVVLGHLAHCLSTHRAEFEGLGLREADLDAWICAIGEEVQREIDTLIQENAYDGAVRLGDVKSRFLTAVLLVSRRRLGRRGQHREEDTFNREAIDLVRQHLERERFRQKNPIFMDLFGGGWRRTVALASVFSLVGLLAVVELAPNTDPRRIDELEYWQARDLSPILTSAYRDHAGDHSMFVGTVGPRWAQLDRATRRQYAEVIQAKVQERGVEEVLLFDESRVLQAHYFEGAWRSSLAWNP